MSKRTLKTLQHLCLNEFKINLYEAEKYNYSGNTLGSLWSALYYQVEGEMLLKSPTMEINLSPNDFYYIPAGTLYDHITIGDAPVKFYIIAFSFRETESDYFDSHFGITNLNILNSKNVLKLFDKMYNLASKNDIDKFIVMSDFYQLFSKILPYLQEAETHSLHPAVLKAIKYINEHLLENFSIKQLADHCFISESRLYHLFNEQLHTTPINYKNHMKIKASFILLTTTNLSVNDIAEKMNFASSTHYRYAFKKTTNSTPTRYRKIFKLHHNNF